MTALPKVGSRAPELSALTDQGTPITLADLAGKWVVLYWYPRDDTPG